jgi:hypothetical protein
LSNYEEWIRYYEGDVITLIDEGDSVKFININRQAHENNEDKDGKY